MAFCTRQAIIKPALDKGAAIEYTAGRQQTPKKRQEWIMTHFMMDDQIDSRFREIGRDGRKG